MDAGLINSIVGGATNLTSSFLGFGASIYNTNHMQAPDSGEYNYNIVLPQQPSSTGSNLQTFLILAFLLVIVFLGVYLVVKKA